MPLSLLPGTGFKVKTSHPHRARRAPLAGMRRPDQACTPRPLCGQDAVTGDGEDREGAVDSGAESPVRPSARALKWPSTNRRIAEDRFPCWRLFSISLTKSESTVPRWAAISFMLVQKASSRLTLVLWPHTTIERFTTGDLIGILLSRADVNDDY